MSKILLADGHAGSTAYALASYIRSVDPKKEVIFVGSKSAVEGNNIPTLENTYLPRMGVRFIPIVSGRIQRKFTKWTIPSLVKIPIGFIHALIILLNEKPDLTVSFGGFSAFPVVFISWVMRIPVILHEQTVAAGRANLASVRFANRIALSRKESMAFFPKSKCVITGNPISNEVIRSPKKRVGKRKNKILIAGGSRGSIAINEAVKTIIPKIIKNYSVYHQTGRAHFLEFDRLHKMLDKRSNKIYIPFPTVEMWKWSKYLVDCDVLISRSGANIVSESVYLGIPSVFIPLPRSYKNEQLGNAKYACDLGLAEIINQDDLSAGVLYKTIQNIFKNWDNIVKRSKKPPIDDSKAAEKLYKIILQYEKTA